ncbi:MAG: PAS domain S-box protein [Ignavibacteriae bacterium]|nr:PAS domain S-box protein [Ignavibacteriota bacterium]
MEKSLRILILEDNELDVQLMQRELQKSRLSFQTVRVQTFEEFTQQLEFFLPDIILADYTLPTMNGDEALILARQHDPDIPFIFVTGTIGEEIAVETLKKGATDYVMKENLKRLGPAVTRALHETEERKAREKVDQAYKDTMNRYREIVENATDIIFTMDYRGYFLHVNQSGLKSCGYSIGEMWKTKYLDLILPEHRERVKRHYMRQYLSKLPVTYIEYPIRTKSGGILWYAQHAVPVLERETVVGFHVICRDVTERRQQSERGDFQDVTLHHLPIAVISVDVNGVLLSMNAQAESLLLWTESELRGKNLVETIVPKKQQERITEALREVGTISFESNRKDGKTVSVTVQNSKISNASNELLGYVGLWSIAKDHQ